MIEKYSIALEGKPKFKAGKWKMIYIGFSILISRPIAYDSIVDAIPWLTVTNLTTLT